MPANEDQNKGKPLLKLERVTKTYGLAGTPKNEVLRGIDLTVQEGESLAIVGPSGSGKTTLLNIVGSLDNPTDGHIFFEGRDLTAETPKKLAAIRSRDIGFIFQMHHLLPQCTVLENILVPTLASRQQADPRDRALRLLERVGLQEKADSSPAQLSGGESQRAAVVRALINQPKLILADEPTGSLDLDNSDNISQLLAELNTEENTTLIVVTHEDVLSSKMGRKFELLNGRLTTQSGYAAGTTE